MYDVAIIGAGPAGSTLARLIDKKYKVLIVEQRDVLNDNTNFTKCCGGLLAPDAQKMLARLGIALPKDILVDPQIFSVRTIDFQNNLERFYQRFYLNINRAKFDGYLASLIPKNVYFMQKTLFESYAKKK